MPRTYDDLEPTDPDWTRWTGAHVIRHQARKRGDEVFLIAPEEERELTFAQVEDLADRTAGGLRQAGATPGDRVVIMARNSSAFVVSWFATAVGDLVEAPVNTAYEGEFLRHQVQLVDARWVILDDEFADRFVALRDSLTDVEGFWVIDSVGDVASAVERLRAAGWRAEPWDALPTSERLDGPEPDARDLTAVFFTSGTTGLSKGVSMPNAQMNFFSEITRCLTRFTEDDTWLSVTPLFHGNAQYMAVYPALIAGGRAVIRSRFSASRWVDQLREHDVTVTNFLGVMMDFVWKQPERPDDADQPLRCVFAAPTASAILEQFKARFGIDAFVEVYGTTETTTPILSPYGEDRPAGAAGLNASKWYDVVVVDPETDVEVPVGEVGEFCVRPRHPWISSLGYFNMPDKTTEVWRNLWFHTGDAVKVDEDGWYYFVDRIKDAIRRRGENISSYEVEQALLAHPAISECGVIGVPADQQAGEDEVMAVIVPDGDVTAEEVWEFCRGRVPEFAIPRYVWFREELPLTPSEKIRRNVLREEAATAPGVRDREAATVTA
ncbi:AMP-binding protein [Nocardioides deserti]|uniref:AMP-binding protein n=1 Tax=Nocardioides deserti TaxID=1588644 RepID=A0ABR6U6L0_9ACTN|nr:AMP-binding protein [Nocardioides deserti]MBC2960075.1 AMP-binding protein [Nocardioides deserti]GGO75005.1 ATP-dependent acyl-CoA ligase [Nocardioides deserti]